jgi:hypothetical protein
MSQAALRILPEERIPNGWRLTPVSETDLKPTELTPPAVLKVPVRRFRSASGAVQSRKPVEVRFTQEENIFIASSDTMNIHAAGQTIESALQDFTDQLVYFYRYYRRLSEADVIGVAARLRQIYLDEFTESSGQ